MTKDQKVAAYEMVLEGRSALDIAKAFGVSRQHIYDIFGKIMNVKVTCAYTGLKRWMEANGMSVSALGRSCFPDLTRQSVATKLNGTSQFKMEEIKSILSYTGLTFEEAFVENPAGALKPDGTQENKNK